MASPVDVPAPRPRRRARRLAFGVHQIAEYALGVALVASALHLSGASQLLAFASGGALVAVNLLTASRFTLRPILSRRAHHVADLALAFALFAACATEFRDLRAPGVVLAAGLGVLLVWTERATQYASGRAVPRPGADAARAVGPGPVVAGAPTAATPSDRRRITSRSARTAGTVIGITRRVVRERARRDGPPATAPPSAG